MTLAFPRFVDPSDDLHINKLSKETSSDFAITGTQIHVQFTKRFLGRNLIYNISVISLTVLMFDKSHTPPLPVCKGKH